MQSEESRHDLDHNRKKKKERWSKRYTRKKKKIAWGLLLSYFQLRKKERKVYPQKAEHCGIPQHFFFAVWPRNKSHPHTLDPLLIFPQQ
jgi:hypothetical protein